MRFTGRQRLRFFVLLATIAVLGTVSLVYVLEKQRFHNPFVDVYEVKAELPEADGVVSGLGQPVNVAGVRVGSITEVDLVDGVGVVTLEIERDKLPALHRGASVRLEPITPLKDMQLDLDPGDPDKPRLAEGATLPVGSASSPVPLHTLLNELDDDTREYVQALLEGIGRGTEGRGDDLRKALAALAPTTRQVRRIAQAVDGRRRDLARLVTNLSKVSAAAADGNHLAALVAGGQKTMEAVAAQEAELGTALRRLPGVLDTTRKTFEQAGPFAGDLEKAVRSIRPAVDRLPAALEELEPFTRSATQDLRRDIRPFLRSLQPVVRDVSAPLQAITKAAPDIWDTLQSLRYGLNVLAYNPEGRDEGGLFWLAWMAHNANSAFGAIGDAHGRAARAVILANCQQWAGLVGELSTILKIVTGVAGICPETRSPDDVARP